MQQIGPPKKDLRNPVLIPLKHSHIINRSMLYNIKNTLIATVMRLSLDKKDW